MVGRWLRSVEKRRRNRRKRWSRLQKPRASDRFIVIIHAPPQMPIATQKRGTRSSIRRSTTFIHHNVILHLLHLHLHLCVFCALYDLSSLCSVFLRKCFHTYSFAIWLRWLCLLCTSFHTWFFIKHKALNDLKKSTRIWHNKLDTSVPWICLFHSALVLTKTLHLQVGNILYGHYSQCQLLTH